MEIDNQNLIKQIDSLNEEKSKLIEDYNEVVEESEKLEKENKRL